MGNTAENQTDVLSRDAFNAAYAHARLAAGSPTSEKEILFAGINAALKSTASRRTIELLDANNRYLERARIAEAAAAKIDHSLDLCVNHMLAETARSMNSDTELGKARDLMQREISGARAETRAAEERAAIAERKLKLLEDRENISRGGILNARLKQAQAKIDTLSDNAFTTLEVEAALCVWEWIIDRTDPVLPGAPKADVVTWRETIGTVEARHASYEIGRYCLKVYEKGKELAGNDAWAEVPYDWEVIPAICATIDFSSQGKWLGIDFKEAATRALQTVDQARRGEDAGRMATLIADGFRKGMEQISGHIDGIFAASTLKRICSELGCVTNLDAALQEISDMKITEERLGERIDQLRKREKELLERLDNRDRSPKGIVVLQDANLRRVRHKASGGTYRVIADARMQVKAESVNHVGDRFTPIYDMDVVVVYQAEADGSFWVRPTGDMNDGRFEVVE